MYTCMIQQRPKQWVEEVVAKEKAGFKVERGTTDQIFITRQLAEKHYKKKMKNKQQLQAFDSMCQQGLWLVLRNLESWKNLCRCHIANQWMQLDWMENWSTGLVTIGVKQGSALHCHMPTPVQLFVGHVNVAYATN